MSSAAITMSNAEECKLVSEDRILECTFPSCGRIFSSCWSLTRHTRTHTGEKPFKCDVEGCNKSEPSLRHEQTHSDKKEWSCTYTNCGRNFKLKEYLDVHKRTHARKTPDHNFFQSEALPTVRDELDLMKEFGKDYIVSEQLRERLIRNNLQHSEEIAHLVKENERLRNITRECSAALELAVKLLQSAGNSLTPSLNAAREEASRVSLELCAPSAPTASLKPFSSSTLDTPHSSVTTPSGSTLPSCSPSTYLQQALQAHLGRSYPSSHPQSASSFPHSSTSSGISAYLASTPSIPNNQPQSTTPTSRLGPTRYMPSPVPPTWAPAALEDVTGSSSSGSKKRRKTVDANAAGEGDSPVLGSGSPPHSLMKTNGLPSEISTEDWLPAICRSDGNVGRDIPGTLGDSSGPTTGGSVAGFGNSSAMQALAMAASLFSTIEEI